MHGALEGKTKVTKTKAVKPKTEPKSATKASTLRVKAKARAEARVERDPVPAEKRAPKKRGASKRPSSEELWDLPTEEIWVLYRARQPRPEERDELWIEELRNVLMERHYPLVRYIAERLLQTLPKSIELDDLVSAGLFGLMDAIRGFDPDRGIKFKTYCTTRIRGSILDQLRSQDWVPRLVRLKAGRIEQRPAAPARASTAASRRTPSWRASSRWTTASSPARSSARAPRPCSRCRRVGGPRRRQLDREGRRRSRTARPRSTRSASSTGAT